jgi:kynureninase
MHNNALQEKAQQLDRKDPLREFRAKFVDEGKNTIYLNGNSLGRLPVKTADMLQKLVKNEWGTRLIRSWNENWLDMQGRIAEKIADLIGAEEGEVFVGDSTSVNLYKLAYGMLLNSRDKNDVVTDSSNFPSDLYILEGLITNHFPSMRLLKAESSNGFEITKEELEKMISENTALLSLSHVNYKSAFMYSLSEINELAGSYSAPVLWDLSHSVGVVPVDVKESGVDIAVGCTYKYMNGGPGAPAFCYVSRALQQEIKNPIWGWFGHKEPFKFEPGYEPADSIEQFAAGTPSVLSLAPIEPAVDLILEAGINHIWEKSLSMSRFFIELYDELLAPEGFQLGSPRDETKRGSHVSLQHPEGYRISRALSEPKDSLETIILDFRPPDNIRVSIAPLYNTYEELYKTALRLHKIVKDKQYELYTTPKNYRKAT